MADDVLLHEDFGSQNVAARMMLWSVLSVAAIGGGLYGIVTWKNYCVGPWFVLWGCLVSYFVWRAPYRTVIWYELTADELRIARYRRPEIMVLPLVQMRGVAPLRSRRHRRYGFAVTMNDGTYYIFEYAFGTTVHDLQDRLTDLLRQRPAGPQP